MRPYEKTVKIVIADDDRLTLSVLRLMLRENHYSVAGEAMDGEKAVELCLNIKPDIAFIDIDMPKMNGHQAAQQIRLDAPGTKVIMISSLATVNNVQLAIQAGANGFVVKPFNAVKVIEAIDNCMKNNR